MLNSMPAATLRTWRFARSVLAGGRKRHIALAKLASRRHVSEWRQYVRNRKAENPARRVIAISLIEHMGDIVAAEPIARELRRRNPDAWIVWIARPEYRALLKANPSLDDVLMVDCLTEWIGAAGETIFDETVDLHIEGRYCPECYILHHGGKGDRTINLQNYYSHGSLLEIFCKVGGTEALRCSPRICPPRGEVSAVDSLRLPEEFVAVHCTSNQVVRDWKQEGWQSLAEKIASELGLSVIEVGLSPQICAFDGYRSLCGTLNMLQSAEVIRRARLFVGVDSGPAHLANAVGTPGVVLLGHYRTYERYMPYSGSYSDGSNATILHAEGPAASLPVEHVYAAVRERIGKHGSGMTTVEAELESESTSAASVISCKSA